MEGSCDTKGTFACIQFWNKKECVCKTPGVFEGRYKDMALFDAMQLIDKENRKLYLGDTCSEDMDECKMTDSQGHPIGFCGCFFCHLLVNNRKPKKAQLRDCLAIHNL